MRRWCAAHASAWWRAANCLEYFKWFQSRLDVQAKVRVIPLGGNTVFFRREFVDAVRARGRDRAAAPCTATSGTSRASPRTARSASWRRSWATWSTSFTCPHMVTREETPQTLWKFVQQRVRWDQGFIQVFVEGEWRRLPTFSQRLMAVYILGFQFFQAYTGIVAPAFFIAGFVLDAPVGDRPRGVHPLRPGRAERRSSTSCSCRQFGVTYDERVRLRDYAGLVLGAPFFQLALGLAAVHGAGTGTCADARTG